MINLLYDQITKNTNNIIASTNLYSKLIGRAIWG